MTKKKPIKITNAYVSNSWSGNQKREEGYWGLFKGLDMGENNCTRIFRQFFGGTTIFEKKAHKKHGNNIYPEISTMFC